MGRAKHGAHATPVRRHKRDSMTVCGRESLQQGVCVGKAIQIGRCADLRHCNLERAPFCLAKKEGRSRCRTRQTALSEVGKHVLRQRPVLSLSKILAGTTCTAHCVDELAGCRTDRAMYGLNADAGCSATRTAVAQRDAPRAPEEISLERLRVLVVEDEPDTREFVQRLLEGCGARVTTAASATEALSD
jgi:hypothetical protein